MIQYTTKLLLHVLLVLFTMSGVETQRKHKSFDFGDKFQKLSDELSNFNDYFKSHEYGEVKDLLNQFWVKSAEKQGVRITQADPGAGFRDHTPVNDGTEYDPNQAICGDLLECDITLTVEQAKQLVDEVDETQRVKRKVIKDNFYRWRSTTIPYSLGLSNSNGVSAIRRAIAHWEENTCLNFREGSGSDYIYFVQGSGCYSNIGRTGGQQQISIGRGCERMGIAAHEIGHALGFWHEQSRSDRDNYISVDSRNIISGAQGNFGKRTSRDSNNYNIAYDLGSVMHYSSKSFSVNNRNTITTKDPSAQNTIGQREALSFIDIKLINTVYCSSTCRSRLPCQNGGYPDPSRGSTNCNKCKCPSGFGGTYCDKADASDGCGVDLEATSDWQTLRSSRKCNWLITGSGRVIIDVQSISASCKTVCSNYLEIKPGSNFEQTGNRYCCSKPSSQIVSQGSQAVVIFEPNSRGSFELRYRTDGSGPSRPPTTTSTRGPVFPRRPASSSSWSSWASWSSCSATCGMCGWKSRTRRCSGSSCSGGSSSENTQCESRACSRGISRRPTTTSSCEKTIRMPCSWLKNFAFRFFDPKVIGRIGRHSLLSDMPEDYAGGKVSFVDGNGDDKSAPSHLQRILRGKRDARGRSGGRYAYSRRDGNRRPPSRDSRRPPSRGDSNRRPPNKQSSRNEYDRESDWDSHSHSHEFGGRGPSRSVSPSSFTSSSLSSTSNGMCTKRISYNCGRDAPSNDEDLYCCGSFSVSGSICVPYSSRKRSREG